MPPVMQAAAIELAQIHTPIAGSEVFFRLAPRCKAIGGQHESAIVP
jgi:hypothetical protein